MWNTQQNNENAVIKSLVERLEKVEKKLNEISTVVKEPKSEFKYLDVKNATKFLGMSRENYTSSCVMVFSLTPMSEVSAD